MTEIINDEHFQELAKRNPENVCNRALCDYDDVKNCYIVDVINSKYLIYPHKHTIECPDRPELLNDYLSLFAIHYLLTCVETRPSGKWISEKDMVGGVTFFRGPHEIPTGLITNKINNSLDKFKSLRHTFNGQSLDMADAAFSFKVTERIPMALLYWAGDEDFPAEAKFLYDSTLPLHFALDIVFSLATGLCKTFEKELSTHFHFTQNTKDV